MGLLSNLFSEFKIKNGVLVKYTGKDANVEIPNNVTIIGEKAFTECKTLVSVTIPNSVKSIENNAFSFCTLLKEITLPNSVTSIGDWAFFYCTGLVKIVIPSSVESIGNAICGTHYDRRVHHGVPVHQIRNTRSDILSLLHGFPACFDGFRR